MPVFDQISSLGLNSLALLGVAGVLIFLSVFYVRQVAAASRIRERLEATDGSGSRSASGKSASKPFLTNVMEKVGRQTSTLFPTSEEARSALRKRLIQAGYFAKAAPYWYTGARIITLIVPQLILLVVWPSFFSHLEPKYLGYAALGLGVVGFIGPSFYLDKRIGKRQDEYRDGFPDMMDLLVACVEAGLSLDAAVGRVSEELVNRYPNLADHLKILTLELRAGRSRQDAWASLAERLGLDEARSLSTMLRQSEELGTSIGQTLRIFSDEMREKRMLTAEEKALALPAKLVVPLILFVFPSLLGVLLLPAIIRMMWVMEAS